MAIRRVNSTQDETFDPMNPENPLGIAPGEPPPGSFTPNPVEDPPPQTTPPPTDTRAGIVNAYQSSLGRTPSDAEILTWLGNADYANQIANSPEAKARAQGQTYARTYDPMAGFDVGKLNSDYSNTKYNFGRSMQEYGGWGRGNLQGLVDYYNTKYHGHAKVNGDDRVDFGESYGPVDVINGDTNGGQWVVDDAHAQAPLTSVPSSFDGVFSSISDLAASLQPSASSSLDKPMAVSALSSPTRASSLSTALEAARMPYEIARKSQMNNARAALADRGLLSEPGHAQGAEASAINQVESNLAPAYTQAVNDRLQQLDALGLAELEQNRLWSQFLNDFGLHADQVRYDMQHGNTDQYLQLLQLWLNAAQTAANGYI